MRRGWHCGVLLSRVGPRMWNLGLFQFILLAGLIYPAYCSLETRPTSKAEEIRTQIEKNFQLKEALPQQELYRIVTLAVNEANPAHGTFTDASIQRLSHQIVNTAQCYGIDPVIYTSLIWRESNFRLQARSERGAVGLTQMTRVGVQEVLERLSPASPRRIAKLRNLVRVCNPHFLNRVQTEVSGDTVAAWKNAVIFSATDALVMGAVLFKVNLASSRPETKKSGKIGIYEEALQRYNGDQKIKVQFSHDVLRLAKRMVKLPEVALNESKFLSRIRGF